MFTFLQGDKTKKQAKRENKIDSGVRSFSVSPSAYWRQMFKGEKGYVRLFIYTWLFNYKYMFSGFSARKT